MTGHELNDARSDKMNEISITAWVMFGLNIVTPVSVAVTSLIQSRPKAKPTHWAGIRVAATMSSPAAWRAAHQAAFRWSRFDLIGVCGAALTCLLLLRARWLVLAECVLYACCLVSLALNTWHAVKAAEVVGSPDAAGRP
ncbi:MAG: hypothetical protein E7Z97_07320 [Propionibacteriaceae bacterium]|nr:hypothetical protein [Propionibacteriaceae bacterium]